MDAIIAVKLCQILNVSMIKMEQHSVFILENFKLSFQIHF